ncbi:carboxypeptidase [Ferrimonas sediminicola]|uniref:Carboxypeptidase n=1 Tax=Ferrimonas sediminicola TaxID=2569538 RepID=A0A4U1BJH2_9GAMM|nr:M14 family metallopeptidase [Ferrimonas sediminicola]TKB51579.1 carboxypeptidase [Ferrimonas sediminicola]
MKHLLTAALLPMAAIAQYLNDPILPPLPQWQGASERLQLSVDDPRATPAERSGLSRNPDYRETRLWLDALVAASDKLHRVSLGTSPQGREIWMVVASKEGTADPARLHANGRPTVLVQAGIHAGEIDGKDAGMMLLRDMVAGGKGALLDRANLLFVPIFNVDGHERRGLYNRVNQRGPEVMGWRTTASNLNRDYAKADTPEMQAMLTAINLWDPLLYIDVHATDGIDYQYDVTYGYNLAVGHSPATYRWLEDTYRPSVDRALTRAGHTPGPLVFALDNTDLSQGLSLWNPSPRYSNGYGDVRHLPTILIENHSLKSFRQRVLGTYVMLEHTLELLADKGEELRRAVEQDRARRPDPVILTWESELQPQGWDFKGIGYTKEISDISGAPVIRWNGQPQLYPDLPVTGRTKPGLQRARPEAYYIPPQWQQVLARLRLHGIQMSRLEQPQTLELSSYTLQHQFADQDYEGRQRVAVTATEHYERHTLEAGTWRIGTDQPLGDLAIQLLEPEATDSLLQWGFFNPIFTRTEYIEQYAVEPMAQKMLESDPALKKAFGQKLAADPNFANNPQARLRWFYENSSYYDSNYQHYPVLRKTNP